MVLKINCHLIYRGCYIIEPVGKSVLLELESHNGRWCLSVAVSVKHCMSGRDHSQAHVKWKLLRVELSAVNVAERIHVVLFDGTTVPYFVDSPWELLAEFWPRKRMNIIGTIGDISFVFIRKSEKKHNKNL